MNSSTSDMCPQCRKPVEILNGDVNFSLELHRQSHKSLETIAQDMRAAQLQPITTNTDIQNIICPKCNEYVDILNNDIPLSFQLHNQLKIHLKDSCANGELSASSSKNNQALPLYEEMRIGDLFEVISSSFQAHKQFICKSERNEFFCVPCKLKFGSVFKVPKHIKTESHRDKIIHFLKEKLPTNTAKEMDCIVFYRSELECIICCCVIIMSIKSSYETIENIFSHIETKEHRENMISSDIEPCWVECATIASTASPQSYSATSQNKEIPIKSSRIKSYLNSLPKQLMMANKDCFFENDKGRLKCLNCDCDVPVKFACIKDHLLGIRHITNMKKLQNREPKVFEDVLLTKLAERDVLVKYCKKNLIRFNDYYLCSICNTCICRSGTNKDIERNVLRHVNGNLHVAKHKKALLCNLFYSDEIVRINRSFLRMKNNQIVCSLCDACIQLSVIEPILRNSLVHHLNGKKHKANQTKEEETFVLESNQVENKLKCVAQVLKTDVEQSHKISQIDETRVDQSNQASQKMKGNVNKLNKELKEMETNDRKSCEVAQEVEMDTHQSNQIDSLCHDLSDLHIRDVL